MRGGWNPYPVDFKPIARSGMVEIGPIASVEAFNAYVADVKADRLDVGGWPTRDRAAPEEEC